MTMDFETMMIEDVVRHLDAAREAGNVAEVEIGRASCRERV